MSDPLADARRDAAAPVLCVAQLDGGAGIAEVIDLLLRGVSVVVLVADPTLAIDVFDQCRRIATAEWFDQAQRPVTDQLSDEQVALLLAIRSGDDVEQAARRHHLSERTAARRLNDARRSLGARSTAEAVSLVGRRIDELRHTS
jgi:DNA-binding NarL/FixJ family response regulator